MNNNAYPQKHSLYILFVLLFNLMLSGCIDLSGSRSTYKKMTEQSAHYASKNTKKSSPNRGEVHTMLGGLGMFSIGMNQLRDQVAEQYKIPAYGTIWYNAGYVSHFIINRYHRYNDHSPVILMGHSLGANDQIKVARNLNKAGIPVDLLVTIDAVSQTMVPPNVKHALNLYKPGYVPMFSGLKLKAVDPSRTVIENINVDTLGIKVNHFTIDKNKVVQAVILDRVNKVLKNGKRMEKNV